MKDFKTANTGHRAPIQREGKVDGATTDYGFVRRVVNTYQQDQEHDIHNVDPGREDIRFVFGDQWVDQARADRERNNNPVLTLNRLPAFVAQYIGSWLQSDTTVKLTPARGGTKTIAEVRQGIIRAITRGHQGKHAVDQAMMHSYICGVGNFGVELRDTENDVFSKDICLKTFEDPFSVVWDRAAKEMTGADANHCYALDWMTREDFKSAYPDAVMDGGWPIEDNVRTTLMSYGWGGEDMIAVCQFWQMRREPVTLGLEAESGDVIDVTNMSDEERAVKLSVDSDGALMVRETVRPYAECYVMTATQVLEGPYRLDIPRLPIFRVPGWYLYEGNIQHRWGFVRHAKDPQRLHNYWRSKIAEGLLRSVGGKWLVDIAGQKGGAVDSIRNAEKSNDSVIPWDSGAGGVAPKQLAPVAIDQALLAEAGMTAEDIKAITNKHEASLGVTSNEVSGRAITARQRVSELGDVIYIDHMNAALAEAGRVINELIPAVYDTARSVKVMGEDDAETLQAINGDLGDETPDVTRGKYDITYSTGPSYATKRQEAVDTTMTLMNTMPQAASMFVDILLRNMDIPGAEEMADRAAMALPPGMVNIDNLPEKRRQKIVQQQESQQQAQQREQQKQDALFMAGLQKTKAEIAEIAARAAKNGAQAEAEQARIGIEAVEALIKEAQVKVNAAKIGAQYAIAQENMQSSFVIRGLDAAQAKIENTEAQSEDETTGVSTTGDATQGDI